MNTPALDAWTRRMKRLGAFGPLDALWRAACAEYTARRLLAEGRSDAHGVRIRDGFDGDAVEAEAQRVERRAAAAAGEYLAKARAILRAAAAERTAS